MSLVTANYILSNWDEYIMTNQKDDEIYKLQSELNKANEYIKNNLREVEQREHLSKSQIIKLEQSNQALEAQVADLKNTIGHWQIKNDALKWDKVKATIDKQSEAIKILRDAVERFCNDEGYSKKETSGHYLGQALSKVEALLGGDV